MEKLPCPRYFSVQPSELAYIKSILESYEGLVTMHTLDGKKGLVEILFPSTNTESAEALLTALACETELREIPQPEGYISLIDAPRREA